MMTTTLMDYLATYLFSHVAIDVAVLQNVYRLILSDPDSISVRLTGGSNNNEGRVDVYYNRVWGTVCDEYWHTSEAKVVCKQLGLPYTNAQAVHDSTFGQGSGA